MTAPPLQHDAAGLGPAAAGPAPDAGKALRQLFLTLFLRGRTSRGLQKSGAPKSVASKLGISLVVYALYGLTCLMFFGQPTFALALYLHATTLAFVGLFVAASSGEVLFNREEADILMHRPVASRDLLRAKASMLIQLSLWLAGAFNIPGLVVGVLARDGSWGFPPAHLLSTALESLFCVGGVVLLYQFCLSRFGRERLDGLMTTAQVLVAIAAIAGGQIVPQLLNRFGGRLEVSSSSWWLILLPPAWFAGLDDALAGSHAPGSWGLAALALVSTAGLLWAGLGRLSRDYEAGLQSLQEGQGVKAPSRAGGRSWLETLATLPPFRWWLRNPLTRSTFLLIGAYLTRDRDVKLRVYPSLAPMLVMPVVLLLQDHNPGSNGFGVAFAGSYLGLLPLLASGLLLYSQHWQAADLFRLAPLPGPGPFSHGLRRAVLLLLITPVLLWVVLLAWIMRGNLSHLPLLLPGVIALPVYSLIPCRNGQAIPFSLPTEEAKSATRGLSMIGFVFVSMAMAAVSVWSWSHDLFIWFLLAETVVAAALYLFLLGRVNKAPWPKME